MYFYYFRNIVGDPGEAEKFYLSSENLMGPLGWFTRSKINRRSFYFPRTRFVSRPPSPPPLNEPWRDGTPSVETRPSHTFLDFWKVKIFANFPLFGRRNSGKSLATCIDETQCAKAKRYIGLEKNIYSIISLTNNIFPT